MTAVHLSLLSEDSTRIYDVAKQVVNDLVEIFGDLDELHVVGAIDFWLIPECKPFWNELKEIFCGKSVKFQEHQEGICMANFKDGKLEIKFRDS